VRPQKREISPLSPEQARRFLKACEGERLESLFVLAVHTGMRQGARADERRSRACRTKERQEPPADQAAKLVQERLGHATTSITLDTYSHVLPGMDDGLADAMGDAFGGVRRGVKRPRR